MHCLWSGSLGGDLRCLPSPREGECGRSISFCQGPTEWALRGRPREAKRTHPQKNATHNVSDATKKFRSCSVHKTCLVSTYSAVQSSCLKSFPGYEKKNIQRTLWRDCLFYIKTFDNTVIVLYNCVQQSHFSQQPIEILLILEGKISFVVKRSKILCIKCIAGMIMWQMLCCHFWLSKSFYETLKSYLQYMAYSFIWAMGSRW